MCKQYHKKGGFYKKIEYINVTKGLFAQQGYYYVFKEYVKFTIFILVS